MPQGRPSVTWCPRTAGLARVLAVGASALSGCFGSSLRVGRPEDDHLPPASLGAPSTLRVHAPLAWGCLLTPSETFDREGGSLLPQATGQAPSRAHSQRLERGSRLAVALLSSEPSSHLGHTGVTAP